MSDPVALRAIDAVAVRLLAISGVGAYHTNIAARAYVERDTLDPEDLPCVVVRAPEETAETVTGGKQPSGASDGMMITQEISVEGFVPAEQVDTGRALQKLKADIKRAVLIARGPPLTDADGVIGVIAYVGSSVIYRKDGSQAESVQCRFQAIYTERFGDPAAIR